MIQLFDLVDVVVKEVERHSKISLYTRLRVPCDYIKNNLEIRSIEYFLNSVKQRLLIYPSPYRVPREAKLAFTIVYYIMDFECKIKLPNDDDLILTTTVPNYNSYFGYWDSMFRRGNKRKSCTD